MSHPQQFRGSRYALALVITTGIFALGILLGNAISQSKLDKLNTLEQEMRAEVIGTELQYQLMLEHACNSSDAAQMTDELYTIGTKLDFMENNLGKDHPQVLSLKEYYSMLELEHWLLLKKVRKQCNTPYNLVLYFYSNHEDCNTCDQQGHVLNYMHEKYPAVNIYSFDINIDNPALNLIKRIYGITEAPTLVINEQSYVGFRDRTKVESALGFTA